MIEPIARPAEGEVHVWCIGLMRPAAEVAALAALLAPDEAERAARFRFPVHARRFTVARAGLRQVLAGCEGGEPAALRFDYGEQGKPALAGDTALRFNVSHSGELALVAVTVGRELGVDVEEEAREVSDEEIVASFFSAAEQREFCSRPVGWRHAAFLHGWTRKEAYIKAKALGLSLPLASFDVALDDRAGSLLLATRPDPAEAGRWSLVELPVEPGYVAALAVEAPQPAVQMRRLACWPEGLGTRV